MPLVYAGHGSGATVRGAAWSALAALRPSWLPAGQFAALIGAGHERVFTQPFHACWMKIAAVVVGSFGFVFALAPWWLPASRSD